MICVAINQLFYHIRLLQFKRKFHEIFPESHLYPGGIFDLDNVIIGKASYGPLDIRSHGPGMDGIQVKIRNYVSIAENVQFMVKMEHSLHTLSTYPFNELIMNITENAGTKGPIIVGDDVWIGDSVKIMSGVTIGQGAVIGTGAVVTKNIEPYSIVGGVPAKIIGYRFPKNIRNQLLKIDYSQLSPEMIINNIELLYSKITDDNIAIIMDMFSK